MQVYTIMRNGSVVLNIKASSAGAAMRKYCTANRINIMQASAMGLSVR